MATTVYSTETIELRDGTSVTLKPLNIKALRLFMKKFGELDKVDNEDDVLEVLFALAAIGLKEELGDRADDKEDMSVTLDMPTINRIIKVCGGIDLDSPKPQETETENPGTN